MVPDYFKLEYRLGDVPENLVVLDLGCGKYVSGIASRIPAMYFKKLISVDGYAPDLAEARKLDFNAKEHDWILGNIREIEIPENDVTILIDVIEHQTKEDALALLKKIEGKTRRIVLYTPDEPDGFHRSIPDENGLQEHLSYWREGELRSMGYEVERISGVHTEPDGDHNVTFDAFWAVKNI